MFVKFCTLMLLLWNILLIFGAKSGPFKSSYTRVGPCASPTQPVDSKPPVFFYAELYNSSTQVNLMRGNVTIVMDHQLKQLKAKSYVWINGEWKVNYLMNNLGCNRVIFPFLCMATGVKYDPKSCTFYKGVYIFDSFDINKIQHMWMSNQEYGKILWKVEVFTRTGSVFCYELETLVEQANTDA